MKKILPLFIIIVAMAFASCGSDEIKADASDTLQKISVDTMSAEVPPEKKSPEGGTTRSVETENSAGNHDKNAILANIDQYLVSKPAYPDPGNVVIENTLQDVTVQKAIIEVTILKDDSVAVRLDYYIVNNIEPGGNKTIKITGAASGTSARCHVVKMKSNELTDGELILVGRKFVPK